MLIQRENEAIYKNYSSSIVTPKLIQISPNLTVALFELMKLIPAKYVIRKALAENKINPNYPIVETSSGTYALGMGIVCSELKIPFFIISDPVIDTPLLNRLKDLGGKVQIIGSKADHLDVQTLRLEYLNEYLQNNKKAFWPAQYHQPDNRVAYYSFADHLLQHIEGSFTLVGAVGSGGSTCGTIERLRKFNKNIKLVGVDTFGSVLFGLEKKARKLRGLGNSIYPQNLIHEYYDQVHWLNAECAYKSTRALHSSKAIFSGPTTGAAYHVAQWIAENNQNEKVIFISPDTGSRYTSTVYNDNWLKENNMDISKNSKPMCIQSLAEANEPWSYINWDRRSYDAVIND